jgi:hypothetical protein
MGFRFARKSPDSSLIKRHWPVEVCPLAGVFCTGRETYNYLYTRKSTRGCSISLLGLSKSSCIQRCNSPDFDRSQRRSERKGDGGKKE